MVLLLATLAFLAAKLATKNHTDDDQEGILEDDYEEEYRGHFDTVDNERAIFIIEESDKLGSLERVNLPPKNEETDKIVPTSKEEQIKPRNINNLLKQLSFDN